MEESSRDEDVVICKKKKPNPQNYKRNQIKKARLSGKSYETHKGKKVEEKKVKHPCR